MSQMALVKAISPIRQSHCSLKRSFFGAANVTWNLEGRKTGKMGNGPFPSPAQSERGKRQHSDFLAHWSRDDDDDSRVGVLVPEKSAGIA